MSIAIYPGSFNPITFGHLDLIERGAKLFSRVVVGVCKEIKKSTILPAELRMEMMKASLSHLNNVSVLLFDGLASDFAKEQKGTCFLRGARDVGDFAYEEDLAKANFTLSHIETLFLSASPLYKHHRSSWIRDIARSKPEYLNKFIPKKALDLYLAFLAISPYGS